MDLRNTQLKDTYGNLVTTGTTAGSPTTGGLQNGQGTLLTSVGIGTNSTSAKLTLNDAGQQVGIDFKENGTTRAHIEYDGSLPAFKVGTNGGAYLSLRTNNDEKLRIEADGDIAFYDDANNQGLFWDASTARLGIGTTEPGTVLDIHGAGNVLHVGTGTDVAQYMSFRGSGASGAYIGYDGTGMLLQAGDGKSLRIKGGNATFNSGSTGLEIDTSGQVGIGVSPSRKLSVNGAADFGNGTIETIISFSDRGIFGTQSNHDLEIRTNGTERMRITASGNVGIGTTSPTEKLQIVDSANDVHVRIGSGNAGINPTLRFHGKNTADTTNVYADIRVNPDNQTLGFSGTGTTGGSIEQDALVIDSSGNVGIGTSSPSKMLDLSANNTGGASASNVLRFTDIDSTASSDQESGSIEFYTSDSSNPGVGSAIKGLSGANGTASANLLFEVSGTERMRIDSSGYLRLAGAGIQFNGDTAEANALDDYEEGTWTPLYAPTTGSFTTMTMDVVGATYTKIGRQVTVRAYIRTDEVVVGTASGVLKIDGLPFSCATGGQSSISLGYIKDWSTAPDAGYVNSASSSIFLHKTNASTNSDVADLTTGAVANQNVLILNLTYFV